MLGLEQNPSRLAVVQMLNQLANTLGIDMVAECVENEELARILREAGVCYGQGFHLGVPQELRASQGPTVITGAEAQPRATGL